MTGVLNITRSSIEARAVVLVLITIGIGDSLLYTDHAARNCQEPGHHSEGNPGYASRTYASYLQILLKGRFPRRSPLHLSKAVDADNPQTPDDN